MIKPVKLLFLLCVIIISPLCTAQDTLAKPILGAGIEWQYSVNGHGSFIIPHLSYCKGKHSLKLGCNVHKRTTKISGAKLSYAFMVAGMDAEEMLNASFNESTNASWRVHIFSFVQYNDFTALSYQRVLEEELLSLDSTANWNSVRISTLEGGLGAELDVKLFHYLQIRSFIGVSVYNHFNHPELMYMDKTGATFVAGIGLNIPSFRRKSGC